jgi:hypothetical protein
MRAGSMRPRSRLALAAAAGALMVVVLEVAGWWVPEPDDCLYREWDWQSAAATEFTILGLSVGKPESGQAHDRVPLAGRRPVVGSCRRDLGFDRPVVTYDQIKAEAAKGPFTEHILVSRPNYSLLHLRAAVAWADVYGNAGGDGYMCLLHRGFGRREGFGGWRLDGCRNTWIA